MAVQQFLDWIVQKNASDLHLVAGSPPMMRLDGGLVPLSPQRLSHQEAETLVFELLSPDRREQFIVNREIDFSYQHTATARFRVNAYYQLDHPSAALRLINPIIKTSEELRLPPLVHTFAQLKQGLILITGPTGHGKSTTLATIIEEINQTRPAHIVTIEDPIEFLYQPQQALISQREMKSDTHSWEIALRSVLREDPDVVLVGEMRDYETIAAALTIAETGHLVFATLHTNSAAQTIDRIIDVFPDQQQHQVRQQFALSVEAIFSQRLIPAVGGGRVPAVEAALGIPAVRNLIREGKSYQIDNIIQTSGGIGMVTLEMSLAHWVNAGVVKKEAAMAFSLRPVELERLIINQKAS